MSKHKSSSSFTPFIDPRLLQISPSSGSSLNNMGKAATNESKCPAFVHTASIQADLFHLHSHL